MRTIPYLIFYTLLTLLVPGLTSAPAARALTAVPVLEGLSAPVRLTAPAEDDRLFVVEKGGRIKVFTADGQPLGVFLDLSGQVSTGGERGLLGLAFAPDYAASGRFYVNYTDTGGDTRVVRYQVDGQDPDRADPDSAHLVLQVEQPFSNHNGGHLEFGPDGMLYIGLGDGGSGGDPGNRAQNSQSLLGKMLRIDVSVETGYTVPQDNPFVGTGTLQEIWALGLRNPWCFGFDRQTGDLWIADVGQSALEEINRQPAASTGGENYGWRLMEGTDCYNPASDCNDGSLTLPVHEYTHGGTPFRCSISGGYVYRGSLATELSGRYLYADYCSGQVWALDPDGGGTGPVVQDLTAALAPAGGFDGIASFGQDAAGEMYIVDIGGTIYRIVSEASSLLDVPRPRLLEQNVPNPFNPATTIAYTLPPGGGHVRLTIHDTKGALVRRLLDERRPEGRHALRWNGTDDAGRTVPAGVYVYRLQSGVLDLSRKMVLLK